MRIKLLIITLCGFVFSCSSTKEGKYDGQIREDFKKYIEKIDNKSITPEASDLFVDAMVLQQQEKWAESLIDLDLALKQDSSAGIYYAIARAYSQLGRNELSIQAMEKSLDLNPSFLPTLEMLVEMYVHTNNLKEAIVVQKKILGVDNSLFNRLNYANLVEMYKPIDAIPLYEEILKEDPKNEKLMMALLELYKATKNNDKFKELLEKLQGLNNTSSTIGLQLLDFYLDNKEYSESVELLNKIDKNIPTEELKKYYGTVGYRMLYDSTMNDKQIINSYLEKLDSRFYFDWQIHLQAGYLASKIGNTEFSNEMFNKALKFSDTIPDIYVSIGLYYLQKMKDSIAIVYLADGYKKFADDYRFPFFLGVGNQSLKNYETSVAYFKRSNELSPEFLENWVQLGVVYDLMGKGDSSDYYYEGALKIDSLNPLVNNNYAYSLSVRGERLTEAEEMSEIALSMEPKNVAYLDTYAWINFLIGKYDRSLEFIEKAIKQGDASAEVYEHYGEILMKLNRKDDAIKAYKNSLKLDPARESVIERLKIIERK